MASPVQQSFFSTLLGPQWQTPRQHLNAVGQLFGSADNPTAPGGGAGSQGAPEPIDNWLGLSRGSTSQDHTPNPRDIPFTPPPGGLAGGMTNFLGSLTSPPRQTTGEGGSFGVMPSPYGVPGT